ncbi:hypothetical protein [Streptomyces sp. NPDC048411]|uniref:hypothetical protein n=1 Tax=Streptomyces sp. NPDC048411 TaxID=3157206 RepID=UPI00345242E8
MADGGDPRVAVAREQQAWLVDSQLYFSEGVAVQESPQGSVKHDRWVVAVHAFSNGVVAHEVLRGLPGGLRSSHDGGDVAAVVAHEAVGGIGLDEFERGLP